jgi:hypothetical protein
MLRYLPLVIATLVAVPLTIYEGFLSDRWNPINTQAIQCAMLLDKITYEVPTESGVWIGYDEPVEKKILDTAGAEGYLQRTYENQTTGQQVAVWLIVGHYRDIVRHTPDLCYSVQGFKNIERDVSRFPLQQTTIEAESTDDSDPSQAKLRETNFFTTKFGKPDPQLGWDQVVRVYWAWWMPEAPVEGQTAEPQEVVWVSPDNPRLAFKYPRALYKLYFTTLTEPEGAAEATPAVEFATAFLPLLNEVLAESGNVMNQPMNTEQIAKREAEVLARFESTKADFERIRKRQVTVEELHIERKSAAAESN